MRRQFLYALLRHIFQWEIRPLDFNIDLPLDCYFEVIWTWSCQAFLSLASLWRMAICFSASYFHICWELVLSKAPRVCGLLRVFSTITYTSRLSYIENPFLDCLFLSKTVSSLYLEALGEQVKSLVKSDLFP